MPPKAKAKPKVRKPVAMDTTLTTPEPAPTVEADPNGNIDQRMAALLKDHQAMGARPADAE